MVLIGILLRMPLVFMIQQPLVKLTHVSQFTFPMVNQGVALTYYAGGQLVFTGGQNSLNTISLEEKLFFSR